MKKGKIVIWTGIALLLVVFTGFLMLQPWKYRVLPVLSDYDISYGMKPEQVCRRLGDWTKREESTIRPGTSYSFSANLFDIPADIQLDFYEDRELTSVLIFWKCEDILQAQHLRDAIEKVFQSHFDENQGFSREQKDDQTITFCIKYDGATGQYYKLRVQDDFVSIYGINQE